MNNFWISVKEYFEGMNEKYPISTHIILGGIAVILLSIFITILILICNTFGWQVVFGWLIIFGVISIAIWFLGEGAKKLLKIKNTKKQNNRFR